MMTPFQLGLLIVLFVLLFGAIYYDVATHPPIQSIREDVH